MAKSRKVDVVSMTEFGDDEDPLQALTAIRVTYLNPYYPIRYSRYLKY